MTKGRKQPGCTVQLSDFIPSGRAQYARANVLLGNNESREIPLHQGRLRLTPKQVNGIGGCEFGCANGAVRVVWRSESRKKMSVLKQIPVRSRRAKGRILANLMKS
ncbi:MAG: hypothetical protein HKN27_14970 [Silicimonas sp.]|nr:hypothetical protein [Silicimonas sp.]